MLPTSATPAVVTYPVSILYKSIAGRYRLVRVADGPITARYIFIKNASWGKTQLMIILPAVHRGEGVQNIFLRRVRFDQITVLRLRIRKGRPE